MERNISGNRPNTKVKKAKKSKKKTNFFLMPFFIWNSDSTHKIHLVDCINAYYIL